MSLTTFSAIYYNFEFDEDHQYINFDEGSGEETAQVELGEFTATGMAIAIQTALNDAGTLTYIVTFNRADRSFTIEANGNFDLLVSSGSSGASAFSVFGFTGADRTGSDGYTGGVSGSEYIPQFVLQDHISTDNFQKLVSPSVNKSANGEVEVIRFGTEKFMQVNIKFITNLEFASDGKWIRRNPTGVEDVQDLMRYLTQKKPFEFMPDELDRNTFQTFILETTPDSQNGTGYKLKELYDKNLPNFYETGVLLFRLIEES